MKIDQRLSAPGHIRFALAVAEGTINPHAPCPPTTQTRTVCLKWAVHHRDGHEPIAKRRTIPR